MRRIDEIGVRPLPAWIAGLGDPLGDIIAERVDVHPGQSRGHVLVVKKGLLIGGECDRLTVDFGGKSDVVERIADRERDVRCIRKIDIG